MGFIKITYDNIRGVDFSSNENQVERYRSPDMVNMWKSYKSTNVSTLEKIPNLKYKFSTNENINGVYEFNNNVIWHIGGNLFLNSHDNYLWSVADNKSTGFIFGEFLYLIDGEKYIRIDKNNNVSDEIMSFAYTPTTSINRAPNGSGGTVFEDVNLLTPKRINTFVGDGTSTVYKLNMTLITLVDEVKVGGVILGQSSYSVNNNLGEVTFNTAPPKDTIANVEITFSYIDYEYIKKVQSFTKSFVFDNRVFFYKSSKYKNQFIHSKLNKPEYISDNDFYADGVEDNLINNIVIANNNLYVFKEKDIEKTIYIHTPTLNYEYGKVYPMKETGITKSCYNAFNFMDDIVFLSKDGVSALIDDSFTQNLYHRSTTIDKKMILENLENAKIVQYNNYLFISFKNNIYIANSKDKYPGLSGSFEYEWFFADVLDEVVDIKLIGGVLYFILNKDDENQVFILSDTISDEKDIFLKGYVTTLREDFGTESKLKVSNKKGCVFVYDVIQNADCNIYVKTNKTNEWKLIGNYALTGFDFSDIDFSWFAFSTFNNNYVVIKLKEKKYIWLQFKIESDNSNFSFVSLSNEAIVTNYVKR